MRMRRAAVALLVLVAGCGSAHHAPIGHRGPSNCFAYDPVTKTCQPYQDPGSTTTTTGAPCVTATTVVEKGAPPLPKGCPP